MSLDRIVTSILSLGVTLTTPLAIAGIGEVISERAGVINLGIDGIMLLGAFAGYHIALVSSNYYLGYLAGVAVGLLMGLILAVFSVYLKLNQAITGMGLYFIGFGLSDFLYRTIYGMREVYISPPQSISIPLLSEIPIVGPSLFQQLDMVYFSYILVIGAWILLYRSKIGLWIRSVGENPKAADTVGINVDLMQLVSVLTGSALAGLAGAFLSIGITQVFYENLTYGIGFIAIGLVYFGKWDPARTYIGSLIFGLSWSIAISAQSYFNAIGRPDLVYFLLALPYLAVTLSLIVVSRQARGPRWLGKPYIRE
ncbi:ABC transporter permease [Thermogladius sp. 4427co]|uniref:ABC transporter permease n=1 Tax=Thermogladius sp. 4427co TaxID=3450718 RepID=UPI003F79C8DB